MCRRLISGVPRGKREGNDGGCLNGLPAYLRACNTATGAVATLPYEKRETGGVRLLLCSVFDAFYCPAVGCLSDVLLDVV